MHLDVRNLRDFYARPLGRVVRRLIIARLRAHWPSVSGLNVVGLGFATPYLTVFRNDAASVSALMPAGQGAILWPAEGPLQSALIEEHCLPLADNSVDRIILAHCLEVSEGVQPLLRQIWRVMKPEGRMIVIVPNRRSIWARFEATPFGHGRPYSRGQVTTLLGQSMFTPIGWSSALHMPPWEQRFMLRSAPALERLGSSLAPAFSGALIVEAKKELMAPISGGLRVPARARLAAAQGDAFTANGD